MCAIFLNYLFRIFNVEKVWNIFIILIPIQFILFIIFAVKNGVFGIRIKFEKYNLSVSRVFNHISDSVIIINENLELVEVNESFKNNFGQCYEYDNLIDVLNKTLLKDYVENIFSIIEEKSKKIIPISVGRNYYDLEVDSIVKDGVFHGVFIIGKDVTEHKNNLILLKSNQNQIVENQRYDTFVSLIGGIAHNLKTPVMTSLGGVEILKKQTSKIELYPNIEKCIIEKQYKWEKIIQSSMENVSRAIQLIQNQSMQKKEYNFDDIERELKLFLNFELVNNGCILVIDFNINLNIKIEGTILHILNNLIINAIHSYFGCERDKNLIEVKAKENINDLIISVTDYGIGISEEVKSQIFKGMITTKGNNGSGLGLYISNILVKAKLGGSIWFESEYGKGTTFFISISK
jgi:signal transduction histidine kinase